jgi:hypothetical protein
LTFIRLLNAGIWHNNKKALAQDIKLVQKLRTQDVLKEIELLWHNQPNDQFRTEQKSPQQNFDEWLINQGIAKPNDETNYDYDSNSDNQIKKAKIKTKENSNYSTNSINKHKKIPPISSAEEDQKAKKVVGQPGHRIYTINPDEPDWNYSTKVDEKEYEPILRDFYPRDPYTCLPQDIDILLLNKELKGKTVDEIRKFMNENLLKSKQRPPTIINIDSERPVYQKPKSILDAQHKLITPGEKRPIDSAGLTLCENDMKSFPFKQAAKQLKSKNKSYYNTANVLDQIKKQLEPTKDEKLEIVRRNYGSDLSDFMLDKRRAQMSQKYEKVFII